jgi:hypothetical protein
MAKFLVLIYGDEKVWAEESDARRRDKGDAHAAFFAAVPEAGAAVLAAGELGPTAEAISLRADEQPLATDGPFLETKEAIGGYYLLEAADLDQVVALARRLPELSEPRGGIEIRPVR